MDDRHTSWGKLLALTDLGMIINVSSQRVSELYGRALEMYFKYINNKDNAFLAEEIFIPFEQVKLKNSYLKIVFFDTIDETYSWEVSIGLWDKFTTIGTYTYLEDCNGNLLGESLHSLKKR
jgi:hypothetical protein